MGFVILSWPKALNWVTTMKEPKGPIKIIHETMLPLELLSRNEKKKVGAELCV